MSPKKPNRVRICSLLTAEDRFVTWTTAVPGIPLIVKSDDRADKIYEFSIYVIFVTVAARCAEHGTSGQVGGA